MIPIASYACQNNHTLRRQYHEPMRDELRSVFQQDYDRIIHSTAFRRLEYKTQVFVNHEGDHYRTRLTHTIEVASVVRVVARLLGLNEYLSETLALSHDLGHPPFGHAGEHALNEKMLPYNGFDHNLHTLKLITTLEQQYHAYDGLNLSWHTLEGIAKHNGPIVGNRRDTKRFSGKLTPFMEHLNRQFDLELQNFPSLEAQIASVSDDIAYNNHDIDDGIRANLFTFEQLIDLPGFGIVFKNAIDEQREVDPSRISREAIRALMQMQINDLTEQTQKNIVYYHIKNIEDVYHAPVLIADFSPTMKQYIQHLKKFLYEHMYTHQYVNKMLNSAKVIVHDLFDIFFRDPEHLPGNWKAKITPGNATRKAEVIADYIAGMTDRYAIQKHRQLCNKDNLFSLT